MKKLQEVEKLAQVYNDHIKVKCKCGHTHILPVQVHFKICSHCGRKLRNDTKAYFMYQLRKKTEEIKSGNSADNKLGSNSDNNDISI